MTIAEIVQRSDTTPGRIFDSTVIALILVSVIAVSINTLPDLSSSVQAILTWSEVIIVGLFTVEYGLRVGTGSKKAPLLAQLPWSRGSGGHPPVLSHTGRS